MEAADRCSFPFCEGHQLCVNPCADLLTVQAGVPKNGCNGHRCNERKAEAQSEYHWMIVFISCFQMFSQRSMASIPVDSIANSALDKIWQVGNNCSTTCSPYGSFPGERGCWHLLREARQSDFEQEAKTARKPWQKCVQWLCVCVWYGSITCMCVHVYIWKTVRHSGMQQKLPKLTSQKWASYLPRSCSQIHRQT